MPTGKLAADTHDPAATVTGVPPALNEKLMPGATPAPLSLQISRVPRGWSETTVFRNVAIVCPPAFTVTVAVPALRLLLTSNPPGKVVTELNAVPGDGVSAINTAPTGMTKGALQEPPGAGPARTVTGFPATLKVKGVPTATPAPATLQICRKPVPGRTGMTVSRKVAMVCPPALTVTVALPAARLLLTSDPPGKVVTSVNVVPDGSVSSTITGPAGSTSGELQEPPGAGPAATITGVPATVNVKLVPTAMPAPATLQICRNPVAAGRLESYLRK